LVDSEINGLTELAETPASNDWLIIDDYSAIGGAPTPPATKKISVGNLLSFIDTLSQTLTNKTLDSSTNTIHADGVHFQVRNQSGSTITKGSTVYISGFHVGSSTPQIELADSSTSSTTPCIGLVEADITNNTAGLVLSSGQIIEVDTSTFTVGDTLYLSETAGTYTNTKPTGTALIQNIGIVERVHASNGVIHVSAINRTNDIPNLTQNNIWLGNSSGVPTITTPQSAIDTLTQVASATDEHVLTKDTSTGNALWKVVSAGTTTLSGLTIDTNKDWLTYSVSNQFHEAVTMGTLSKTVTSESYVLRKLDIDSSGTLTISSGGSVEII